MSAMTQSLDVLGAPEPVRRPRSSRAQVLVTGAAALSVFVTGVAYAGYSALAPSGHAPEEAMPSGTVAFAKVDLDPSAGQKVAVYRLSRRFPQTHVRSDRSVKDDLLADVFRAAGDEVDYARDVKPWIGDRAGIGAVSYDGAAHPLIAVQFHDRDAAKKGVQHLVDVDTADDLHYAFSDVSDYLLLSDAQGVVDSAARASRHLADDSAYRTAVDALHGDQIVTAWADLGKAFALVPKDALGDNPLFDVKDLKVEGRYVLGLHAEDDALELDVRETGASTGIGSLDAVRVGRGSGSDLVQTFPADALAAISTTGLGDSLARTFDQLRPTISDLGGAQVLHDVAAAGISLPGDLRTVLGDEVAGYLAGDEDSPTAVLHVRTAKTAQARAVLSKALDLLARESGGTVTPRALDEFFRPVPGGYLLGVPHEALTSSVPSRGLGTTAAFRQALPDAKGAPFVLYVDLQRLRKAFAVDSAALSKLEALGVTARSQGDTTVLKARLTFR